MAQDGSAVRAIETGCFVFAPAMFPAEELQANIRRAATGMQRYLAPADATVATETHVIP